MYAYVWPYRIMQSSHARFGEPDVSEAVSGEPDVSEAVSGEPDVSEAEESSFERQWLRHASAAEATAAAAREGLPLIRSAASATGFLNVQYERQGRAGYIGIVPNVSDQRSHVHILCATPEAAALAVARHMGKEAAHAAAARSASTSHPTWKR